MRRIRLAVAGQWWRGLLVAVGVLALLLLACSARGTRAVDSVTAANPEEAVRLYRVSQGSGTAFRPVRTVHLPEGVAVVVFSDISHFRLHPESPPMDEIGAALARGHDGLWTVRECCKGDGSQAVRLTRGEYLSFGAITRHDESGSLLVLGLTLPPNVHTVETTFDNGDVYVDGPLDHVYVTSPLAEPFAVFTAYSQNALSVCRIRALDAGGAVLEETDPSGRGCPAGAMP